uniref:DUF2953 domain-containing protein n=1 Tax=Candidatus Methanophagaceae archaeon ANME-1 ERB6 TaxID=2759912 RepID=A0A7G9YVF2_9EURY|nr:hypothetical protein NODOFMBO_00008 [Methanosarcinales archaeon ANME-1 ERB6]
MDIILILLIVLAIIVVLIAATLLIPVNISLRLFKDGPLAQVRMSFGFLLGIVSGRMDFNHEKREFRLRVLGVTLLRRDLEERKEEKKPTDWKKIVGNANKLYAAGKDLAGALTKNISIKRLGGRMKVGLSDPCQTGMLIGFLYAGSGIAKAFLPETSLEIEPAFDKEQMDADIEIGLSLPLFKTVIPLIRFFRRIRKVF